MMKWLMLVVSILAFGAAWQSGTPGELGLSLLIGVVAAIASFLGFLAARVASVAQTQPGREAALLVTARGRVAAKRGGAAQAAGTGATAGYLYGGGAAHDAASERQAIDVDGTETGGGSDGGDGGGGGGGDGGGGGGD